VLAQSARMGWMPSHPTFNRNPLDLADEIAASGQSPGEYVVERLRSGELRFAGKDPDAPENYWC
jgi:nitrate reductase / nitrite oxidoreductase, alpha subunit